VMSYADASLRIIGKFLDQVVVAWVRWSVSKLTFCQVELIVNCDLVKKKHLPNNIDPKIMYFIAGIPDICTLTRDKKEKYEELPGL
jgi:hypothetical protein